MRWMLMLLAGLFAASSTAKDVPAAPSPTFFALSVADLDASVDWYAKMLRLKPNPIHDAEGMRITLMTGEKLVVELIEHQGARAPSLNDEDAGKHYLLHGLFKVGYYVDDLDAEVERLRGLGATFKGRVVSDKLLRAKTILVQDNEGNIVQLFQRLKDD